MKAAIVIPAYNEGTTIDRVVKNVAEYGTPIVVDDGSSDNTAEVAAQAGAKVVQHKQNQGYDAALQSGFELASEMKIDFIITFDADGQHSAEILPIFLDLLDAKNFEIVLGFRSQSARIAEYCFSTYCRWRYGVSDILCGMKGYRVSLFREYGYFDTTKSIGTELALYALRKKVKFTTIDVPIHPREEGEARIGNLMRANFRIFRAMFLAMIADLKHLGGFSK